MGKALQIIKEILKAAPKKRMERTELIQAAVAKLVATGKSAKKAARLVEEKMDAPIFAAEGSKVTLVKKKESVAKSPGTRSVFTLGLT